MLNIFYQKNTLNDTLIINVSLSPATKIVEKKDAVIGYNDKELVFVNVKNASIHFKEHLAEGLLFPCKDFMEAIKGQCGIDLLNYFDNGFKIGQITKCEDIQGTHLHKTEVNVGDKTLHVVCGAPNAKVGLTVVCATNGTRLPNGKIITAGQLLGNKSEGMLCSFRELGLPQETERGIIELDSNKYKVGEYYHNAYANCREK